MVPTGLVSADKANRYYTDEQKADLDIKTSVNKIGEIINFSQILNSLLWDNIASGQTIEENLDLYADISQLDVCSNIEIDKAKKIFNIDMGKELAALKKKYNIKDDDGLNINPKFFMHVAKKKGYYIKGHKNYKTMNTTMDYVQNIVNRAVLSSRNVCQLSDEPLSYVLDKAKYSNAEANRKQIASIETMFRNTKVRRAAIYKDDSLSTEEKRVLNDRIMYGLRYDLSKMVINYSTAYELLNKLDRNKADSDIRSLAFYTLLSLPSTDFYKVFAQSLEPILTIVQSNENPDLYFYNIGYKYQKVG